MVRKLPKDSPEWRAYERQIAELLAALDPNADVVHNRRIEAKLSQVNRQIDVWVRGSIIGQEITIAVECKHHVRPLDIGVIDEFVGKLLDVGADRGIIYSSSGMTENAAFRANAASSPSVIPVSLQPAPSPRTVLGPPTGLDDSDYADWLDSYEYRKILLTTQWFPWYDRNDSWRRDPRWEGVEFPEEWEIYEG